MDSQNILDDCQEQMNKTIESLKKEFVKVRTGRANPAILDNVRLDYYGTITPLNQLGNIAVGDDQLSITPWDKKILGDMERAILKANLGLNPQNDGNLLRIPIPPLTKERRDEMVKLSAKFAEDHKNSLRLQRRESNQLLKDLEKDKQIGEDDLRGFMDKVQKLTDQMVAKIEDLFKQKKDELLDF